MFCDVEVEIGVLHVQAKGHQGQMVTPRAGMDSPPAPLEGSQPC